MTADEVFSCIALAFLGVNVIFSVCYLVEAFREWRKDRKKDDK